ncbi:MAG: ankyrin repeat domain-containing protein, partial [Verrucomicrobium sp.]|nr:ankyrin repeat domain-containing protein [Verrucomicrobium sp.]
MTARHADLTSASVLVDLGSDLRATDPDGNTVLHLSIRNPRRNGLTWPPSDWLARKRRHPVGTWLLQNFVRPEPTPHRRSFDLFFSVFLDVDIVPMREAPMYAVPNAVAFFLACGADVHATNRAGQSALSMALDPRESLGTPERVQLLSVLQKAARCLDAPDSEGGTPLHALARQGWGSEFEALLAAGADARAADRNGRTAAHLLLDGAWPWDGVAECLDLLVRSGADLGAADRQGRTPLHVLASLRGANPLFLLRLPGHLFLPDRVDFNARDARGDTPLHLAARGGDQELFEWFVARGARLDATNALGETPRRLASTTDFPSIVARRTPKTDLFLAIEAGDAQAVASILASDPASLQRARPDGMTPLRRAVDLRHTRIIDLLHQRGVAWDPMSAVIGRRAVVLQDLLARSPGSITNAERGRGLLHAAAEHADVSILEQLLAAGADPKALDPWGLSPLGISLVTGRRDIEAHLRAKGLRESVFDAVHGGRREARAERLRLDPESARTPNGFGVSAAAVAAGLDRPELLEAFFAAGVAPDLTEPFAGR